MGFTKGLQDFLSSVHQLLATDAGRGWYMKRLVRSVVLGSIMLFTFLIILGFGVYAIQEKLSLWIQVDWVSALASVGVWVVAAVVIYFSAGPITLLIMGIYLSQVGEWEGLRHVEKDYLPSVNNSPFVIRNILNTVGLTFLILFLSILSLIPIFSFLAIVAAAFSLGKDWCWSTDEVFGSKNPNKSSFAYCLGLGLLPALVASIPIVGVATLPILQMAASKRYLPGRSSI